MFKIGQKVLYIGNLSNLSGKTGIVNGYSKKKGKWDIVFEGFDLGHNGMSNDSEAHNHWFCYTDEITEIPDTIIQNLQRRYEDYKCNPQTKSADFNKGVCCGLEIAMAIIQHQEFRNFGKYIPDGN